MKIGKIALIVMLLITVLAMVVACETPQVSFDDLSGATATMTNTATPVPTFTPMPTNTPTFVPTATSTATPTPLPPTPTPLPTNTPLPTPTIVIRNNQLPETGWVEIKTGVKDFLEWIWEQVVWLVGAGPE